LVQKFPAGQYSIFAIPNCSKFAPEFAMVSSLSKTFPINTSVRF
jgi:hypothetical protein